MSDTRKESDSLGVVEVPADKLWGAQAQRSLEHWTRSLTAPADLRSKEDTMSTATIALPPLEPTTQKFIDDLAAAGGKPLWQLPVADAHKVLTDLQSQPVPLLPADLQDTTFPVGPTGSTRIRIVRPKGAKGTLPVVMYFHGGGWVLGDKITHDRLVREIAVGANAAVVFVDYVNSPESKWPAPNEQAYASTQYVVEHAKELNVDASRLPIVGDSVGGNITAAVTLMAKARKGPKIGLQILLYPVVEYMSNAKSMQDYADGPWLTAKTMKWMFDLYGLDGTQKDITAYPLRATLEQLKGLPEALFIFDDDILRDDGEAYAAKLSQAGVRVTSVRYNGTIHDYAMLNPLADTPAVRGTVLQIVSTLKVFFKA